MVYKRKTSLKEIVLERGVANTLVYLLYLMCWQIPCTTLSQVWYLLYLKAFVQVFSIAMIIY
jgi:hypothetical protein